MYYEEDTLIYLDGNILPIRDAKCDLFSQTLHYGVGVFEGIRAFPTSQGPQMFKPYAHYKRLMYSAKKMHVNYEISFDHFRNTCYELIQRNYLSEAYIRPLIFSAPNMGLTASTKTHFFMAVWKWGKLFGDKELNLKFSSYRKPSSSSFHIDAKICGNYVNNVLATTEAKSLGFDDGILLDDEGKVVCTAGANIFIEKDEVLYTPGIEKIFPGITRQTIIHLANELDLKVVEGEIEPKDLLTADSAFLTGTATDVSPVCKIEDHAMKLDWEDSMGYLLSKKYHQLVTQADQTYSTLI